MKCLLIFILLISATQAQAAELPAWIAKWEGAVAKLEERDKTEADVKDGIVFYGSSSIRLWETLHADLAPWPTMQRGYGGASLPDIIHYAPRILGPHLGKTNPRRCKAVVVFVANDITGGNNNPTSETVVKRFAKLHQWVRSQDATIPFFWIEVTPTNLRWKAWPEIEAVTKQIRKEIASDANTHLISTAGAYLGIDGKPRAELFRKDQLHMNADGYKQWTVLVKAQLHAHLAPTQAIETEKQTTADKQTAKATN